MIFQINALSDFIDDILYISGVKKEHSIKITLSTQIQ